MANSSGFLDEISAMIAERRQEERRLRSQADAMETGIAALEAAAAMYRQKHRITESVDPNELKGKTQVQALIHMAKKGNGEFRVNDAKRLLLHAGMISNPKNAASILYTLVKRSDRFERVSPGVYRLKNYRPRGLVPVPQTTGVSAAFPQRS